ncbi:MAG TPA: hypothetical protein VLX61_16075 [Anaerolineales bacterium]|nr:hypothetical protein [Anaerolineales bacterium]
MKNIHLLSLWKRLPGSWRFSVGGYIALRILYFLWSALILTISPLAIRESDIFGQPILTVFDLQTSFRAAYHPVVDGQLLTFVPVRSAGGQIADVQTASRWSIYSGEAIAGGLAGKTLSPADYSVDKIFPYLGLAAFPNPWLSIWQRFDTNWYISIAERGYGVIPGDIHFPPVYPLLIKLSELIFGNALIAGMIVSGLATWICLKMLYDLFRSWEANGGQDGSTPKGWVYFLIFPTAFFLFGAYTEGLFIVAAMMALHCMQDTKWLYAGIWTCCATLIRLQGVALFVPLIYCMWNDRKTLRPLSALSGLGSAALGVLIYLALRTVSAGSASIIPLTEGSLYARLALPWDNFVYAFHVLMAGSRSYIDALNLLVSLLFLALIIMGWKYIPPEYNLYLVATYLILTMRVVETQPLNSMLRYVLTLFPSFYVLGIWGKRPIVHRLILYPCVVLLLFLTAQFWMWGWVA